MKQLKYHVLIRSTKEVIMEDVEAGNITTIDEAVDQFVTILSAAIDILDGYYEKPI